MSFAGPLAALYEPTYGAWSMSMSLVDSPLAPTGWWHSFGYTAIGAAPPPAPVPLPAAMWLFGSALLGLGILGRQKSARRLRWDGSDNEGLARNR